MDSRTVPVPTSLVHGSAAGIYPSREIGMHDYPHYEKGTTTLGFIFNNEGLMVTLEHARLPSGSFPENLCILNSHLLASISGGNGNIRTFYLSYLQTKCREHEHLKGARASAAEASKWLADFLSDRPYSDDPLSLGTLIAGWDDESGPALYKVNAKGERCERPFMGTGSSSDGCALISIPRDKISVTDASKLAKRALCLGVCLVPESCECVSVFHIGSDGLAAVVFNDDIGEWLEQYFSEVGENHREMFSKIRSQYGGRSFVF
ncbi:OLC1v1006546C1 [Oldenlandia corymbosa var. corymbosa]|uniref:OLC1v1006546C1 n=1 Tax=Oldenlandia corymbosa var. corymbosa TaxID=529605 RepID=A0AAV1DHA0_OLDCO|nr:OLC1v1006546C1 [Oldenlandia corymbosa var. corymbosa]